MKIFKSKKIKKLKIKKIVLLLLISFFSAFSLSKLEIFKNDTFINILKYISINKIYKSNIKFNGKYLINIALTNFDDIEFTKEVFKQEKEDKKNNPVIYIYNTHQTEEYKTIENYNLTPTVLTASYILKDYLKEYDIESIVEESDLKQDLNSFGYSYNNAYKVSRNWLEKLNNSNMLLYIDLHRDSVNYNLSNVIVDGIDYAKIMFVVGTNYDYEVNMNVAKDIIKYIEKSNKSISRGIFTRNSIYNQDFNNNCVLIEIGGPESSYESVSNSLKVLAHAINNYIGDKNGR